MNKTGITVYNCESDEMEVFLKLSSRFGIVPSITSSAVSENNAELALGNQCISVGHKSKISESMLCALKEAGVKYISSRSIGINHIDTEAAKRMGISFGNVTYSPSGVADYTLMLMLMAIRNAKSIVSNAEKYDYRPNTVRGKELRDMTVGILGTGSIGQEVIKRLRGFGCQVVAHDRRKKALVNYLSFEELLRQSDIISIHVPLLRDTYHMIGREQIEMMKHGAFLINTARGGIVDTNALIHALESNRLSGAALDVLEDEEGFFYFDCREKPIQNHFLQRLQEMPNVIITPHTAYFTKRALYDTVKNTILNCLNFEGSRYHE